MREANHGAWPVTLRQCERIAAAYGNRIRLQRECSLFPGLLADRLILVHDSGDPDRTLARCVHELVEAIVRSPAHPELRTPGDATAPHQVARLVEREYAIYLRFHRAGEEQVAERKARARQRRQAEQLELVWEADEYSDPPFRAE